MKIELTEGCICDSFEIDGKTLDEFSVEELKEILVKVTNKIVSNTKIDDSTRYKYHSVLYNMTQQFYDEYNCDKTPCECCGDYVETSIMHI